MDDHSQPRPGDIRLVPFRDLHHIEETDKHRPAILLQELPGGAWLTAPLTTAPAHKSGDRRVPILESFLKHRSYIWSCRNLYMVQNPGRFFGRISPYTIKLLESVIPDITPDIIETLKENTHANH